MDNLKVLTPNIDVDVFMNRVCVASRRVLMLDYDGVLAPFHTDRDKAFPYPGITEILNALLASKTTRLVIISGRAIDDLVPLLSLQQLPEIWGSHGWEHLTIEGHKEVPSLDKNVSDALEKGLEYVISLGLSQRVEKKPVSIAVHWRSLNDADIDIMRNDVLALWNPLTKTSHVVIDAFDGGLELKASGRNKGYSVNKILSEEPEDAIAAYLGDDLTDEDAFKAVKGRGIGFLVRPEIRSTHADVWLLPPDELLSFLKRWLQISQ